MKTKNQKADFLINLQKGKVSLDELQGQELYQMIGYDGWHKYYINKKPVSHANFLEASEKQKKDHERTHIPVNIKVSYTEEEHLPSFAVKEINFSNETTFGNRA